MNPTREGDGTAAEAAWQRQHWRPEHQAAARTFNERLHALPVRKRIDALRRIGQGEPPEAVFAELEAPGITCTGDPSEEQR